MSDAMRDRLIAAAVVAPTASPLLAAALLVLHAVDKTAGDIGTAAESALEKLRQAVAAELANKP